MVEMADGVRLFTAVAVPKGVTNAPTVLMRDPYNNLTAEECIRQAANSDFAKSGYTLVRQHVRGKGLSEGFCIPYHECSDGLATHDFIRSLPSYNGEIFLTGQSYLSSVHLACIGYCGDDIKGAALHIQTDQPYSRNYVAGCNDSFGGPAWWLDMMRRLYPEQNRDELKRRPYCDMMKRAIGVDIPEFTNYVLHTEEDDVWKADERYGAAEKFTFPVLLTEGWYDMYIEGMLDMWKRLPVRVREKSAMLICPWGHRTEPRTDTGFAMEDAVLPSDWVIRWFDSIRNGTPYPYAEIGKIKYYSIGGDHWSTALPSGESEMLFFADGKLTPDKNESAPIRYRYDPEAVDDAFRNLDYFRYHDVYTAEEPENLPIAASFSSIPTDIERHYRGRIRCKMEVASDCEDTAFYMHVYLKRNGVSYNLTESICALSYFHPGYIPGTRVQVEIVSTPLAFTLKPGDSIRVDFASAGGTFAPHANIRGHYAKISETKVANNTIFSGGTVELPLRS